MDGPLRGSVAVNGHHFLIVREAGGDNLPAGERFHRSEREGEIYDYSWFCPRCTGEFMTLEPDDVMPIRFCPFCGYESRAR